MNDDDDNMYEYIVFWALKNDYEKGTIAAESSMSALKSIIDKFQRRSGRIYSAVILGKDGVPKSIYLSEHVSSRPQNKMHPWSHSYLNLEDEHAMV